MVNRARPTRQKREKEKARQERHQQKLVRREESKVRRATAPPRLDGEDPDLAGIRPGPQPPLEGMEPLEDEEAEEEVT